MPRSAATSLALLTGAALATLWGFNWLLGQRFSSGEARAPYSTLRADPLGAKALHDALNRLPGTTSERHYRSLSKLDGAKDRMLVCLHVTPEMFHDGEVLDGGALVRFAAAGGRVLVTLDGQRSNWDIVRDSAEERREENRKRRVEQQKKKDAAGKSKDKAENETKSEEAKEDTSEAKPAEKKEPEKSARQRRRERMEEMFGETDSLGKALGVSIDQKNFVMTGKGALKLEPAPAMPLAADALPEWFTRTTIDFTRTKPAATSEKKGDQGEKKNPADQQQKSQEKADAKPKAPADSSTRWETLAKYQDGVMLAQRHYGSGVVVIATDSYFASNEALFKAPSSKFINWLVGGARTIIFDESHLGSNENPGVMSLARRHHLHGLFFGGLLLFGLFVWKSSMSLVPAEDEAKPGMVVAGQGATAGLVSLLKRGVPLPQVLRKGLESWQHGGTRANPAVQARLERARQLLPPEATRRAKSGAIRDIYRLICETLHNKTK